MTCEDYKSVIAGQVQEEETFLRLTLSKKLRDDGTSWTRITVRPVLVRGRRALQFSFFDGKKDTVRNVTGDKAAEQLDAVLAMPFGQFHVQATSGDLQVLVSRKGRVHIKKLRPSRHEEEPVLAHDRVKRHPLPATGRDPLLRALRIVNKAGKVRAAMRGKFRQINEFLRILDHVVGPGGRAKPVRIVDCGCGSAYLTFAAYHHLVHGRNIAAEVIGIDTNEELIEKCTRLSESLGWEGVTFRVARIAEFEVDRPPDVVLSLHACDTATDEALARGVGWKSRAILAAPCCQHELHDQLRAPALRALLRHGILKERLADLVTDAFRALALRIEGYRTSVVEFVSPEATSKNLLLRAERGAKPGGAALVREYNELKAFWGVTPAIEVLLGDEFARRVGAEPGGQEPAR